MIQSKAKNKYWQAGKRWRRCWHKGIEFDHLDFVSYKFIIGDKIFEEPTDEARAAFDTAKMWERLQQ